MCKRQLEHREDFELMSETASPAQIQTWTTLADAADKDRLENIAAMDIYNIALPKGLFST
jgi:hypothetical protein